MDNGLSKLTKVSEKNVLLDCIEMKEHARERRSARIGSEIVHLQPTRLMSDGDALLISDTATTASHDKTCFRHTAG
jgi:hypothetical protein